MADICSLVILKGPNTGSTIDLKDDEVTMGREPSNSLCIDDHALSRYHARLVKTSSGYTLQDLGSTNGTYVNGSVVSALYPLKDQDRITIGETIILEFHKEQGPDGTDTTRLMPASENKGDKTEILTRSPISGGDQAEKNVALVQRFFEEVWNKGNLNLVDELLAQDFEDHGRPPGTPRGHKSYKSSVNMFRSAFPDIRFTLDQIMAEDDRVAIRLTGRGTHKGNFMGIAPTGKQASFGGMTFMHIQDGKVAERWGISDIPGLMQQLGVGPGQLPAQPPDPYDHVSYMGPKDSKSTTRVLGVTNQCKATKDNTRGIYSLFVSSVPAGESVPIHTHLKEDEAYYLLDGQWEVYDFDHKETLILGPDTYVYVPMGMNYGFKNISDQTGRLVLIITPGGLEGFFEGIGQIIDDPENPPPPPSGPPDFIKAAQVAARYNITFIPPQ